MVLDPRLPLASASANNQPHLLGKRTLAIVKSEKDIYLQLERHGHVK